MVIKLNLGCGSEKCNGYINIDIRLDVNPDMAMNLEVIPYPFNDNYVDEILANDIIEHFPYRDVENVVREWHRILKKGGKLIIKTPDLENLVNRMKDDSFLIVTASILGDANKTWLTMPHWIYGGQDYSQNYHKLIFSKNELKKFLEYIGFNVDNIINDSACGTNMVCYATKR